MEYARGQPETRCPRALGREIRIKNPRQVLRRRCPSRGRWMVERVRRLPAASKVAIRFLRASRFDVARTCHFAACHPVRRSPAPALITRLLIDLVDLPPIHLDARPGRPPSRTRQPTFDPCKREFARSPRTISARFSSRRTGWLPLENVSSWRVRSVAYRHAFSTVSNTRRGELVGLVFDERQMALRWP